MARISLVPLGTVLEEIERIQNTLYTDRLREYIQQYRDCKEFDVGIYPFVIRSPLFLHGKKLDTDINTLAKLYARRFGVDVDSQDIMVVILSLCVRLELSFLELAMNEEERLIRARNLHSDDLTPNRIWNIEQNRPILVAKDLAYLGIPIKTTMSILLARGVFKCLAVQRDLIRLKNVWKSRITDTLGKIRIAKENRDNVEHAYLKGYLKAYEESRRAIRALCRSDRWQAPDNDKYAMRFLKELENDNSRADPM